MSRCRFAKTTFDETNASQKRISSIFIFFFKSRILFSAFILWVNSISVAIIHSSNMKHNASIKLMFMFNRKKFVLFIHISSVNMSKKISAWSKQWYRLREHQHNSNTFDDKKNNSITTYKTVKSSSFFLFHFYDKSMKRISRSNRDEIFCNVFI